MYETRDRYKMVSKSKYEVVATFLIVFRALMNVLLIIKVKILMLSKWSYISPPPPRKSINHNWLAWDVNVKRNELVGKRDHLRLLYIDLVCTY